VAMGVCNPLQWRNRPRFSRGSLTFVCDVNSGSWPPFSKSLCTLRISVRLTTGFSFFNELHKLRNAAPDRKPA